jgi:glycerol kinase
MNPDKTMSHDCFIGIDQGSSSTKALAVSVEGRVLVQTKRALQPPVRRGDRIEHDPLEILKSVQHVLDESMQSLQAAGSTPRGIGLSCQRSSCLIWNEATGEPLSPVLSWRDLRGNDIVQKLTSDAAFIYETTGLPLTPYYSASKFRWLNDNAPASRENSTVFGTLSSFLTQHLSGNHRAVIDHTSAARTQLMNIHTLDWDTKLLDLFGLSHIRLPQVMPTAMNFGGIQTAMGRVPLVACIGDQQAAMLGLGVMEQGDGGINYGTGGFLMVNTGAKLFPAKGLMASIHYSTGGSRHYLLEGSVNAVGDALEWLRSRMHLFSDYEGLDDLCWQAATDVVAFIGLNGTGAPHWESAISSSLHGMTAESTSGDIIRAAVENIAFFMKDITEKIRTAGVDLKSFAVSGGLSSLSYLVQIQADILGKDLLVSAGQEVSALGAALLAGLAQDVWTPEDIKRLSLPVESITPRHNIAVEKRYRRWRELHWITKDLDEL